MGQFFSFLTQEGNFSVLPSPTFSCPVPFKVRLFLSSSALFCFSFLIPTPAGGGSCRGRLARGWAGKKSGPGIGDWKEPCEGAQTGMLGCSAAVHWTWWRHAGVALLLLMFSCWLMKPGGEELEWKITFLSKPSVYQFPVCFISVCVLSVNVLLPWEGCKLSSLKNGCAFLHPNVLLQNNFPCSFLPHYLVC